MENSFKKIVRILKCFKYNKKVLERYLRVQLE